MANFARLDDNNIVIQMIVVANKELIDPDTGLEDESLGIAFCRKLLGGRWKQSSYNGRIRGRHANIGYTYNEELDAFIEPKPFESWILDNTTTRWNSPLGNRPELTESQRQSQSAYIWDEEAYQADNTTGWVLVTPEVSE